MRSRLTTSAPPALLLVVAVLIAYLPALQGGYIWDDNRYVTENPILPQPDGLAAIWTDPGATIQYYPMVFTTFWLEYRLWGLNPLGYHATNILLHALSALLLWAILRRLAVPGAWLAAALFALHPVHVESVAWVTERKNVLSGLF
jgi:protein O-mannosyl-transferase